MSFTRHVMFKSEAFNTTESRDYFINANCFGDDVARWLTQELRKLGHSVEDEPGQEDFGWYIFFRAGEMDYCLLISYRPGIADTLGDWMCSFERRTGVNVLSFFLGAPRRGLKIDGPMAIHAILSGSPLIGDIRWFSDATIASENSPKSAPES